ncbi:MAG: hypothetical protein IJ952_05495, partial [Alistipes sp.]|nr:hypothetical protein [Alistipes sp.]
IEIITRAGISLDLAPDALFEVELENPMLADEHITVAYSTRRNPTIYPFITAMEGARRNGTLRNINFDSIYSVPIVTGRANGGYTETSTVPSPIEAITSTSTAQELLELLRKLNVTLSKPIWAKVAMLGKDGFIEQMEKYEELKKKGEV